MRNFRDTTYNIYCDESCHLEHDGIPIMLHGAVWCPLDKAKSIAKEIREIKAKHELKWTKISNLSFTNIFWIISFGKTDLIADA